MYFIIAYKGSYSTRCGDYYHSELDYKVTPDRKEAIYFIASTMNTSYNDGSFDFHVFVDDNEYSEESHAVMREAEAEHKLYVEELKASQLERQRQIKEAEEAAAKAKRKEKYEKLKAEFG
jgi:hypothetical protein